MILISEDGKTLVSIDSWDEIIERPGFKQKVNPKEVVLKQIIGRYHIDPKQPCGISSCGTAHNMGYLVVCEGGVETNIGNKCGKKIFGVDFQSLEKTFTKDTNAQRYREQIKSFKNQINNFDEYIEYLKNGDRQGNWCHKKMHWQISSGFEQQTIDRLNERSRRGDNVVATEVALSKKEQEIAGETGQKTQYKKEQVALISGLSAVLSYRRLRPLMDDFFGDEVMAFKSLSPDNLGYEKLRSCNNWINRFESQLKGFAEIIQECNRFLQQENLDTIRKYKRIL